MHGSRSTCSTTRKTLHVELDFYPQAGDHPLYVLAKLEQSAGHDASRDPTYFPGGSLVARQGSLLLDVQIASDLSKPDMESALEFLPALRSVGDEAFECA